MCPAAKRMDFRPPPGFRLRFRRSGSALVCVDKVNLLKLHRRDILQQADDAGWTDCFIDLVSALLTAKIGPDPLF